MIFSLMKIVLEKILFGPAAGVETTPKASTQSLAYS
jgi:hypothetical protein